MKTKSVLIYSLLPEENKIYEIPDSAITEYDRVIFEGSHGYYQNSSLENEFTELLRILLDKDNGKFSIYMRPDHYLLKGEISHVYLSGYVL